MTLLGWRLRLRLSLLFEITTNRRGWLEEPEVSVFVRTHVEVVFFPKRARY